MNGSPMAVELIAHAVEQLNASDSVRKPRMVVRARDPRGSALPSIDQHEASPKSRQVDGGRQTTRAAANDDAIDGRVFAWEFRFHVKSGVFHYHHGSSIMTQASRYHEPATGPEGPSSQIIGFLPIKFWLGLC
jgi:hypothetical protein